MGRYIDETGKTYGRLLVIAYSGVSKTASGGAEFMCVCECGNLCFVKGADLRSGRVISCGCKHRENAIKNLKNDQMNKMIDETGNVYGKLTVLYKSCVNQSGNVYWECVCECGNHYVVNGTRLRNDDITSCPMCSAKSKGELKIHNILDEIGILHIPQYRFDDLRGKNRIRLPFDFALFDKDELLCVIEYQEAQHYIDIPYFRNQTLDKRKQTDEQKREYCRLNSIKLIEIPYWDYDCLDTDYLLCKIKNTI